ncbi:putative secreted protein (Por secretion system target) [Flavobacteriaceae bacterium MAR_2009_75]|nr:putative secreted protein (Por secretion system target) [Flavobacteriaceae bacterium MAR_2009_75]
MRTLFTLLFLYMGMLMFGQTSDRTVIASAGGQLVSKFQNVSFTIGESAVGYVSDVLSIDQGFWASEGILVIPISPEEPELQIRVFPNPVVEELTVTTAGNELLAMHIFSVNSKRVLVQLVQETRLEHKIDVSHITKGVYILQLFIKGKGLKEYKIIKN